MYIHRKRMDLEDKANVVTSNGGQNLSNFLPRSLFCLGRFGRNGTIHPFLSDRPKQNSQRGKESNPFCPPKQTQRPLPCLLIPFFFYVCTPHRVFPSLRDGRRPHAEWISYCFHTCNSQLKSIFKEQSRKILLIGEREHGGRLKNLKCPKML